MIWLIVGLVVALVEARFELVRARRAFDRARAQRDDLAAALYVEREDFAVLLRMAYAYRDGRPLDAVALAQEWVVEP